MRRRARPDAGAALRVLRRRLWRDKARRVRPCGGLAVLSRADVAFGRRRLRRAVRQRFEPLSRLRPKGRSGGAGIKASRAGRASDPPDGGASLTFFARSIGRAKPDKRPALRSRGITRSTGRSHASGRRGRENVFARPSLPRAGSEARRMRRPSRRRRDHCWRGAKLAKLPGTIMGARAMGEPTAAGDSAASASDEDQAIRERVRELTSQVLQHGRVDTEAVKEVVRAVTTGAAAVTGGANVREPLA